MSKITYELAWKDSLIGEIFLIEMANAYAAEMKFNPWRQKYGTSNNGIDVVSLVRYEEIDDEDFDKKVVDEVSVIVKGIVPMKDRDIIITKTIEGIPWSLKWIYDGYGHRFLPWNKNAENRKAIREYQIAARMREHARRQARMDAEKAFGARTVMTLEGEEE